MSELTPTTVFTPDGTSTLPTSPAFVGGKCRDCSAAFFPFQAFGCERCGSANIAQERFEGAGRITTMARVHLHADKGRPAPFTIASVHLTSGAFVRALVAEEDVTELAIGDDVVTKLVPETRPDRGEYDVRFCKKAGS